MLHYFLPFRGTWMERNLADAVETVGRLIQDLKKNADKCDRKSKLSDSP